VFGQVSKGWAVVKAIEQVGSRVMGATRYDAVIADCGVVFEPPSGGCGGVGGGGGGAGGSVERGGGGGGGARDVD
jgi:hypothetical protein